MVKSAYIHIPFCRSKCHYCSFVSFPILERKGQYLNALKQQVSNEYKGEALETVYFGGGTPSLLTVTQVDEILKLLNIADGAEVTLEVNPETVDAAYFQGLRATRVNRLSIGSQSFDDRILKKIGRRHKAADVFRVVQEARATGFENISLDFIYGLPEQSLESFISDLKTAVNLGVEHISLYGLKIEEGCFFARQRPQNLADDELQSQMYLAAIETLTQSGFVHYEISNFSRCGKFSRHNVTYWKNQEYYGFGLAAHGYVDGVRYSNKTNFEDYCSGWAQKDFSQKLSCQEILEEEIFLGLRLVEGINPEKINQKFNIDFEKKYENVLRKYLLTGHLLFENGAYKFSKSGFLVSNYILAEFLE
ncbi:MAG: radical SAM family heme chaperone HemW [Fusobacterium sp.]|nr:radical SAM family heme chaperone HemW [Fusobacterium sp.]